MQGKLRLLSYQTLLLISVLSYTCKASSADVVQHDQSPLTIAVASNFYFPLSTLIKQSEYWSTQPIKLVSGSSGTLYAQITKGAPFDMFFSADTKRPQNLEAQALAFNRQTYAHGKLVLWPVSQGNGQEFYTNNIIDVTGKLAIANPQIAPFGVAAHTYINTLKNAKTLYTKLVLGTNVTQAFQFVDSGNAQFGILAESTLIQAQLTLSKPKYAHYALIPFDAYPAIMQQLVIVSRSENKAQAQKFVEFILSKASQQRLSSLGYIPLQDTNE